MSNQFYIDYADREPGVLSDHTTAVALWATSYPPTVLAEGGDHVVTPFIRWNDVPETPGGDQEVFIEWRRPSSGEVGVFLRAPASQAFDGYHINFVNGNNGTTVSIFKGDVSVASQTQGIAHGAATVRRAVAQIVGGTIRVKVWRGDQHEPSQWHTEWTDPSPLTAGGHVAWGRFFNQTGGPGVMRVGVGINGRQAPRRPLTGRIRTRTFDESEVGTLPSDWTGIGTSSNIGVEMEGDEAVLRFRHGGSDWSFARWDDGGVLGDYESMEVLLRMRVSGGQQGENRRWPSYGLLRDDGWVLGQIMSSGTAIQYNRWQTNGFQGAAVENWSTPINVAGGDWHNIRYRVDRMANGRLRWRQRMWFDGDPEPNTWDFDLIPWFDGLEDYWPEGQFVAGLFTWGSNDQFQIAELAMAYDGWAAEVGESEPPGEPDPVEGDVAITSGATIDVQGEVVADTIEGTVEAQSGGSLSAQGDVRVAGSLDLESSGGALGIEATVVPVAVEGTVAIGSAGFISMDGDISVAGETAIASGSAVGVDINVDAAASASLTAGGSVGLEVQTIVSGQAQIAGGQNILAIGAETTSTGSVAIAGSSSLGVEAGAIVSVDATTLSGGSIAVDSDANAVLSVDISGGGTLSVAGAVAIAGEAALSGASTLGATVETHVSGQATLQGVGHISIQEGAVTLADISIGSSSHISTQIDVGVSGDAAIISGGQISLQGDAVTSGEVGLSTGSQIGVDASIDVSAEVSLSSGGGLLVDSDDTIRLSANITSGSNLAAEGSIAAEGSVSLGGGSSVLVAGDSTVAGSVGLGSGGQLNITTDDSVYATVSLSSGAGSIIADVSVASGSQVAITSGGGFIAAGIVRVDGTISIIGDRSTIAADAETSISGSAAISSGSTFRTIYLAGEAGQTVQLSVRPWRTTIVTANSRASVGAVSKSAGIDHDVRLANMTTIGKYRTVNITTKPR